MAELENKNLDAENLKKVKKWGENKEWMEEM